MRQAKSVFSILKLDVVMNPPVFNNCAGSLAWIWPVWRARIMHVMLSVSLCCVIYFIQIKEKSLLNPFYSSLFI